MVATPGGEPEIVGVHPVMPSRSHLMIPELARVVEIEMVSPLTWIPSYIICGVNGGSRDIRISIITM